LHFGWRMAELVPLALRVACNYTEFCKEREKRTKKRARKKNFAVPVDKVVVVVVWWSSLI